MTEDDRVSEPESTRNPHGFLQKRLGFTLTVGQWLQFWYWLFGILLIGWFWSVPSSQELVKFVAIVIMGGIALFGVVRAANNVYQTIREERERVAAELETQKTLKALEFAERWNDPTFAAERGKLKGLIDGKLRVQDANLQLSLHLTLNFLEELAIAIHVGQADEETARRIFRGAVTTLEAHVRDWINDEQKRIPAAFVEYRKLAGRWK